MIISAADRWIFLLQATKAEAKYQNQTFEAASKSFIKAKIHALNDDEAFDATDFDYCPNDYNFSDIVLYTVW